MKNILILALVFLGTNSSYAAGEISNQTLSCRGSGIEMTIEVYQDGTVAWKTVELKTAEQNEFMGFISAGDSQDLAAEFYSTDAGSDLHVKNGKASVTLTNGRSSRFKLSCDSSK